MVTQGLFKKSARWALPTGVLAVVIKILDDDLGLHFLVKIMPDKDVFKMFAGTVSMLLVFRTVQAVNVYRAGASCIYQISGSWYDSASTLMSFTRQTSANPDLVLNFRHTIVRLFSLLNMLCLAQLEDAQEGEKCHSADFTTLDPQGLDKETLNNIRTSTCKAEVVCQKIQSLVVDNIATGVMAIPPPILSRSFQDLGNGMMRFHEALNLSQVPLPWPLKVVTDFLLLMHAFLAPWVFSTWTVHPVMAGVGTFAAVLVFTSLNYLAQEVENPFNGDANDINTRKVHYELNIKLVALLQLANSATPTTAKNSMKKPINAALVCMGSKSVGSDVIKKFTDSNRPSGIWGMIVSGSTHNDAVAPVKSKIDEFLDHIMSQCNEESDARSSDKKSIISGMSVGQQVGALTDEARSSFNTCDPCFSQDPERKLETIESESRDMRTTQASEPRLPEDFDHKLFQGPITPRVESAELQIKLLRLNSPNRTPIGEGRVNLSHPTSERSMHPPKPAVQCLQGIAPERVKH